MFIPSYKKPAGSSAYVPCEWSSGTDAEIVEALEQHYAGNCDLHEYWSVGDERTVSLSAIGEMYRITDTHVAQNVTFVLSNIGGKYLSDGVTECCFQVDQKDCLLESGDMLEYGSVASNSYIDSPRRVWCNGLYYNAIPETLKPIFKEFINQTSAGKKSSTIKDTTDYFALRAEIEVFGSAAYSYSGEGSQVAWYETSSNRIKQVNGSNDLWWLRSPQYNQNSNYCVVSASGGQYMQKNNYLYGIAPFGCI